MESVDSAHAAPCARPTKIHGALRKQPPCRAMDPRNRPSLRGDQHGTTREEAPVSVHEVFAAVDRTPQDGSLRDDGGHRGFRVGILNGPRTLESTACTLDVPGLRLSYLRGALEIMSPSRTHEAFKKQVAHLRQS
jgi:hypothetical protein